MRVPGLTPAGRGAPEGAEAFANNRVALGCDLCLEQGIECTLGVANSVGVPGFSDAGEDSFANAEFFERADEAGPANGDELLRRGEAGAHAGEHGEPFAGGLSGFGEADHRAIEFVAAEIEEEALADDDEAHADNVVLTNRGDDLRRVEFVPVVHAIESTDGEVRLPNRERSPNRNLLCNQV